jgi:hypothetical protein
MNIVSVFERERRKESLRRALIKGVLNIIVREN